jgi:hypothetical protein
VGNEHNTSGLLQRSVYKKNKMETQTTIGNQRNREQEDNNKE